MLRLSLLILLICFTPITTFAVKALDAPTPIEVRAEKEDVIPANYFAITFYKPTYILPFYYTGSPYNSIYRNNTPDNESLKNTELKYQLSFKVPLWKNILSHNMSLYLGYTQLSYWQAYNKRAFFRETDYEPELFLTMEWNKTFLGNWALNFINIGLDHQSNGFGNQLERSWNRLYVEAIFSTEYWMISLKPWFVFNDSAYREYNPNLATYLGYGQFLVAFKYAKQVFAVQAHNIIESGAKRASVEFTWSVPITPYISAYLDVFSGYGQSLIEYNHRTNSAGLGIALSNWV